VGTPRDYLRTTLAFAKTEGLSSIAIGRHSRVHPSARLVDTAVWDEVEIGPDVELTECIVADGVSIPRRTKLTNCAIVPALGRREIGAERRVGDLIVVDLGREA
jgi:ADP-glucose pyrophosphorylase